MAVLEAIPKDIAFSVYDSQTTLTKMLKLKIYYEYHLIMGDID